METFIFPLFESVLLLPFPFSIPHQTAKYWSPKLLPSNYQMTSSSHLARVSTASQYKEYTGEGIEYSKLPLPVSNGENMVAKVPSLLVSCLLYG